MKAAEEGKIDDVRSLCEDGADVNIKDKVSDKELLH